MQISNRTSISLSLAVWLLHDEYDYVNDAGYISATRLMRPLKQIILPNRIPVANRQADVEDYIASALGKSLHDSIEKAWVKGYASSLKMLGYPDSIIQRVMINPTADELAAKTDAIPIYLEQRAVRQLGKYKIGGKFDMVAEGIVHDNKSTSAFSWLHGTRDDEHALQGSIYRWLNPDKIFEDFIRINYIFTDWQKAAARSNPKYPQSRVQSKDIPLMSEKATEDWILNKIAQFEKYKNLPQRDIPECTDIELWRSEPQFKFYSDPTKTDGRSTKNFDTLLEANQFMYEKGKGIVKTIPGEPKRCNYCDAAPICEQRLKYFPQE